MDVRKVDADGFVGDVIGAYVTREGQCGFVLQQIGTKVVHVYREERCIKVDDAGPGQDAGSA